MVKFCFLPVFERFFKILNMKIKLTVLFLVSFVYSFSQNPAQIVRRAYLKLQGKSEYAQMQMKLIRPSWTRVIEFKYASLGTDYALVLITAPQQERGQAFLFIKNTIYMYNPKINTVIKLGASMLSQNWLGSDLSNDQLLYQGSIIKDYLYNLKGTQTLQNRKCWVVELVPKPDVDIAWGKVLMWIDQKDYLILKIQYFDQDGYLTKTQIASDIKKLYGRTVPTKYTVFSEDTPGRKTVLIIKDIKYNVAIPQSFFTVENLKKGAKIRFDF